MSRPYTQLLIDRMKAVVPKLEKGYLSEFLKRYGQYDTRRGRTKIEAVTTFKTGDKKLTELFEKYVN